MMLINSLLSHATDARWEDLTSELERLNVRKAVVVCNLSVLHRHRLITSDEAANVIEYH